MIFEKFKNHSLINFKYERDRKLFSCLHPILIMIFADLARYAQEKHGYKLVVTQTITTEAQDRALNRQSNSHRTCRAIDIRTKDMPFMVRDSLLNYINNKPEWKKYHYERSSGGHILAYFHNGTAEHIHLAIHARYALTAKI